VYEKFQNLLNEKGIRVSKVAEVTKISPSTFSDWKCGRSIPKLEKLKKLADFFGVTVDYFIS